MPIASDYPFRPVPFTIVKLTDRFWLPRIETNRIATIPFAFKKCEETGRVKAFDLAAAVMAGDRSDQSFTKYPFDDTDVYKTIEGAAYSLSVHPDPDLEKYVDGLIVKIAAAQEPDGYLYTARTINPQHPHKWAGANRWELEDRLSHELYDLGHLIEAAVAYYQATHKRTLLDVAVKAADLLDRTFGPGRLSVAPGHQIIEMALVRLYRVTNDERYVALAKFFLEARGRTNRGKEGIYNQNHVPVVEQTEAVGHAVRAAYMYAGIADVAALTGDKQYLAVSDRIWDDVVGKKLYLTGGIGARHQGEAFGDAYELPNLSAYCETCAAIANVYWNQRLFLLHGDAKYIDVLERSLYNNVISGVAFDGKEFFYPNPLESDGTHARTPWFDCSCCPTNLARLMPSIPGYVYAYRDQTIYVNLFVDSTATITLGADEIQVTQRTDYPWDGRIRLTVKPNAPQAFTLAVRVPGWSRGAPVAGDLYRYVEGKDEPVRFTLNGQTIAPAMNGGYAEFNRTWQSGDVIDVTLPMSPRRVLAHANVKDDAGKVAVERGPLVYAAEWIDQLDQHVAGRLLNDNAALKVVDRPNLLGGVKTIVTDESGGSLTLIPYYAWAHRGKGEMAVWLRRA